MREIILKELEESIAVKQAVARELSGVIAEAAQLIIQSLRAGGKVFLAGNGGSAADAQHLAAEFVGRLSMERSPLPAIALTTNTSIVSAIGNDYGYEHVFSRQLEALGAAKDVFIAISTSGNSPNVLRALETARAKGIKTIGLTGAKGASMKSAADLTIMAPSEITMRIQEAHITIGHIVCLLVERAVAGENKPG